MSEALASADPDFVRRGPRPRASRRASKSAGRKWWQLGGRKKSHRLALVAGGILAVAILGIVANALWFQRTRHPAPLLGQPSPAKTPSATHVATRPARSEAAPQVAPPGPSHAPERAAPEKAATETPVPPKPVPPAPSSAGAAKRPDPIGQLLKGAAPEPRPAAAIERRPAIVAERRPAVPLERRPKAPVASRPLAPQDRGAAAVRERPAASAPSPATASAQPSGKVAAAQRALVKLGFVLEADGVAGATTRKAIERYERDRGLSARGALSPEIVRRLASESGIAIE